jgi:hypothetical protein
VTANPSRWAVDFVEYLRFEHEAAERHELIDGQIVAMAGATRRHNVSAGVCTTRSAHRSVTARASSIVRTSG